MTGQEIMAGLSYVDERFIQEAETATLSRNTPWMKVLSVAACLCILIVGAFSMGEFGHKGAKEEAAAAPEAAIEEAVPAETAAAAPKQESAVEGALTEESAEVAAGELHHIPLTKLRVIHLLEDGSFEAIVEETNSDTNLFEVGMQVTVVVDPDQVPAGGERTDVEYEKTVAEGQLVDVENGAYDAGIGTLYIEGVMPTE